VNARAKVPSLSISGADATPGVAKAGNSSAVDRRRPAAPGRC